MISGFKTTEIVTFPSSLYHVHCTQQCSCYINTAIGQTVHWKKKKLGYKIIYCTDILKYYCAVLHNCNSFMKIGGTVQGCYEPYRKRETLVTETLWFWENWKVTNSVVVLSCSDYFDKNQWLRFELLTKSATFYGTFQNFHTTGILITWRENKIWILNLN